MARRALLQVQKLAPTLLQLTSDAVYHFGQVPAGTSGPPTNSLLTSAGSDAFMVGEFTHRDGSRGLMIVNKDLAKSHACELKFRQPPRRLQSVSPYNGSLTQFGGEGIWLAPGAGALLKIEP